MPAYRLAAPYDRPPLKRRVSGFALALGVNLALLVILLTLGIIAPPSAQKTRRGIVVDLIPANQNASTAKSWRAQARHPVTQREKPVPKPAIVLPVKPTITPPQQPSNQTPWLEMSKDEMSSSDISKIASSGSGSAGDSEVVGRGPNGEALYAAQWAREPSNAELAGYLPKNGIEGFGLVACKTLPENRVEDCVELDQTPGSRLASAVRQAAWQFRVRPPRKGGHPLIGSWVRIRIDYYNESGPNEEQTR